MVPTCREVARILASDELEKSGIWQRSMVRLHLLRCRYCREYAAQLRRLGEAVRGLFRADEPGPEELRRIEEEILLDVPERAEDVPDS